MAGLSLKRVQIRVQSKMYLVNPNEPVLNPILGSGPQGPNSGFFWCTIVTKIALIILIFLLKINFRRIKLIYDINFYSSHHRLNQKIKYIYLFDPHHLAKSVHNQRCGHAILKSRFWQFSLIFRFDIHSVKTRDLSRDNCINEFIKRNWSSGLFWAVGAAEKKTPNFLKCFFNVFKVKK